jgi:hypothetical protein
MQDCLEIGFAWFDATDNDYGFAPVRVGEAACVVWNDRILAEQKYRAA